MSIIEAPLKLLGEHAIECVIIGEWRQPFTVRPS
jgi:hypothetical protein